MIWAHILNTWHQVCRVERDLLDFGKVVLRILVQKELPDLTERELALWPHVSQVEDVDLLLFPQVLGFLSGHCLNANIPAWEVALVDSLVQILCSVIWTVVEGIFLCDEARTLLGLEVQLHVDPVAILVQKLVCVADVSMHLSEAIWNTSVAEEDHELMNRFRVLVGTQQRIMR